MAEPFPLRLSEVQPSQLYISAAKLAWARAHLDAVEPVPVKRLGGRVILTDGHTRALVAWQAGRAEIEAVWDEDELDWDAYQICVGWCEAVGIRTVADLADRVVPMEDYRVLWLQRCAEMQRALEAGRAGE